jgi:hypothetical protein
LEQTPNERPIIFSAEMVKAILAGRKTMTRRVVKPQPQLRGGAWFWESPRYDNGMGVHYFHTKALAGVMPAWVEACPYGRVGNRLWVRETWCLPDPSDYRTVCYRASGDPVTTGQPWRSPIHMFRWASRITLEITGVKVERLHGIGAADIIAEGAVDRPHHVDMLGKCPVSAFDGICYPDLRTLWAAGWEKINGKGSWSANPWVWAISFKLIGKGAKHVG